MKACMNGADWQVCEQAADVMGRAGAAGVRVRRTCGPGAARGGLLGRRRSSVFAGARNHRVLWPRHLSPPFPVSGPRDLETGVCRLSSSRRRSWPRGVGSLRSLPRWKGRGRHYSHAETTRLSKRYCWIFLIISTRRPAPEAALKVSVLGYTTVRNDTLGLYDGVHLFMSVRQAQSNEQ